MRVTQWEMNKLTEFPPLGVTVGVTRLVVSSVVQAHQMMYEAG